MKAGRVIPPLYQRAQRLYINGYNTPKELAAIVPCSLYMAEVFIDQWRPTKLHLTEEEVFGKAGTSPHQRNKQISGSRAAQGKLRRLRRSSGRYVGEAFRKKAPTRYDSKDEWK